MTYIFFLLRKAKVLFMIILRAFLTRIKLSILFLNIYFLNNFIEIFDQKITKAHINKIK